MYSSTLKFYAEYFHDRALPEFVSNEPPKPGKPVYVLYFPWEENFIKTQGLQVIYHGKLSDVVVAVPGHDASEPRP